MPGRNSSKATEPVDGVERRGDNAEGEKIVTSPPTGAIYSVVKEKYEYEVVLKDDLNL